MKKLIWFIVLTNFVSLIAVCIPPSKIVYSAPKPLVEAQIKPKTAPKPRVKVKVAKYVAPQGKALEMAELVAKETGQPVDTISRIMFYESHYDSKAVHYNKNKTTDHGLFQINSAHIKEAQTLGIDVMTDEGNAQFAIRLIQKNGLRDWSASKANWQIK